MEKMFVCAVARTGSNLACELIQHCYKTDPAYIPIRNFEFLDKNFLYGIDKNGYFINRGEISNNELDLVSYYYPYEFITDEILEEEYNNRQKVIQDVYKEGKFTLLKFLHPRIGNKVETYFELLKDYKMVIVKRRNLLDQIISYAIAKKNNIFTEIKSKDFLVEKSIVVDSIYVNHLYAGYKEMKQLEKIYPNHIVIYYEDFCYDYQNIYQLLNIDLNVTDFSFLRVQKQNDSRRLRYIKNIEETRYFAENLEKRIKELK